MKEIELIEALKKREEAALREFMRRYDPLLSYIVRPIVRDSRDVEECLSDIHWKIWDHIQHYELGKSSFTTWLTTVARNTALNKIRRRSREREISLEEHREQNKEPDSEENTVEEKLLQRERAEHMNALIHTLSRKEQELFYRKYYYYQSVEQIAAEWGVTARSVEGKLYRMRKKLQKRWKEVGYDV